MRLKSLLRIFALLLTVGLAGCNTAASRQSGGTMVTATSAAASGITRTQAQAAALAHTGLNESDVTWIGVHSDRDDGLPIYEVEFFSGSHEYDYKIDAATGAILSYNIDYDKFAVPDSLSNSIAIDENAAKELALSKVPGATASDIRIRLDYDGIRPIYVGTIIYGEMKHDFEISATDGTIYEWDAESIYDD